MSDNKYKGKSKVNMELVNDYMNRMPNDQLEQKYGKQFNALRVQINRWGYKRGLPKSFNTKNKVPQDEVCKRYLFGESTLKLADCYNCSVSNICQILKKYRITVRTPEIRSRKYQLNKTFFDIIDSHEKAYFLGLLYADGCNSIKRNVVTLSLHEKDKLVLQKLNRLIYKDKPLVYQSRNSKKDTEHFKKSVGKKYNFKGNYKGRYAITIFDKHISQRLADLGCVSNKSLVLKFPSTEQVPKEFINSFMLGYFDGDGCITSYYSFSITGTKEFNIAYQEILIKNCNLNKTKIYQRDPNKNTTSLQYSGRINMSKIHKFLYKDSTIFLNRKHKIFNGIYE